MAKIGKTCPLCGHVGIQHLQQTQYGAQVTCGCCGRTRHLDSEPDYMRAHRKNFLVFLAMSRVQQYLN